MCCGYPNTNPNKGRWTGSEFETGSVRGNIPVCITHQPCTTNLPPTYNELLSDNPQTWLPG